ncbi:hypothetical protein [Butyrivibrio sp. INlla14]|uniref:hypothetical protein n=1 Tax=Butyrivibrio sp. INlla14 TaxID=1520808 RepID=UPI0008769B6E|nr:hypothetical protein [Butyrivibrio sp. INlla14]SCY03619.1 hypothetical protein SAMN02910371_00820 [Butyrivibrio sp. INlla14]
MSRDKFWFAYELNREKNEAERVYRYNKGLMERKNQDGSWVEEPEQCCIFFGEEMDYEEITEDEANSLKVVI